MSGRRVVITGLGMITPLGVGVKSNWTRLIAGNSGLCSVEQLENASQYKDIPAKVVGAIPRGPATENKYSALDHFEAHEVRKLSKFIQYGLVAAKEALDDSGWVPSSETQKERTGVCVGSGIGSMDDLYENAVNFHEKGYRRVQPLFVPKLLTNMAAGHISIRHQLLGPNHAVATACATGLNAIGDAARFIRDNYADVMVAGAAEGVIHPVAVGGFARARSLSTKFNKEPEKASRPFDADRDGFVLSEGAGVVILEELEHARARNATIYAEVAGYGLSGDASHITSPNLHGDGARRAMAQAIKFAGIEAAQVGYVNAHATSTVLGDDAENNALVALFEHSRPDLCVSSTKGAIGHLLGAAGSVEAIYTVLAVKNGVLPPTLNCNHPGNADGSGKYIFNYISNKAQQKTVDYALTNSFGFGGTNASVCIRRWDD
ncbi:hypothetical protein KL905_004691 [Ogataea polymorpha]|nr:hypothetical protein KL905_004691 [Ogataea polymorpha]